MPPNKKQLLYSQFVLYTTLFNLLQFKLFAIRYFGLLKGVYNLFVFRFIIETPALTLARSLSLCSLDSKPLLLFTLNYTVIDIEILFSQRLMNARTWYVLSLCLCMRISLDMLPLKFDVKYQVHFLGEILLIISNFKLFIVIRLLKKCNNIKQRWSILLLTVIYTVLWMSLSSLYLTVSFNYNLRKSYLISLHCHNTLSFIISSWFHLAFLCYFVKTFR